jgi:hypothetical protein
VNNLKRKKGGNQKIKVLKEKKMERDEQIEVEIDKNEKVRL